MRRAESLFVVILGPDGTGKTTVIEGILSHFATQFSAQHYKHFRPFFFHRRNTTNQPVTQPHGSNPYGTALSILKLVYLYLDYIFGFYFQTLPILNCSSLVIYDRYFYDIIVDPRRARLKNVAILTRFLSRFIPKPDVILILDAPIDVIQGRKSEVSRDELSRQIDEYKNLINDYDFAVLVNSNQPLEKVIYESVSILNITYASRLDKA